MGSAPHVGLSVMLSDDFREGSAALFADELVDALEWNVDAGWGRDVPAWAEGLLDFFGAADRLVAHGVELSLFSVDWTPRQEQWVMQLGEECKRRQFQHLTEHIGFMTADGFSGGTPLPLPTSRAVVELGCERIERLKDISGLPVGLENLAMAFGRRDCERQPDLMTELCERTDGFLLLDLHNLLCQADNFGLDAVQLLRRYPLSRVRELHIAGGRVVHPRSDVASRPFRRDSHDTAIPDGVWPLLEVALSESPNLSFVIVERSDFSLYGADEIAQFHTDYRRVVDITRASRAMP